MSTITIFSKYNSSIFHPTAQELETKVNWAAGILLSLRDAEPSPTQNGKKQKLITKETSAAEAEYVSIFKKTCATCNSTKTNRWYHSKNGNLKCKECYLRIKPLREQTCAICMKSKNSRTWYLDKNGNPKCMTCYHNSRRKAKKTA